LTRPKGRFSEVGFLGIDAAPLVTGGRPNAPRFAVDGIVPPDGLGGERGKERFELLSQLDLWYSRSEVNALQASRFDRAGADARRIAEGDVAKVFDLNRESAPIRDSYGRNDVGQSLLAARRLVEYGVPYVTVNLSGWDSHKRHFETMKRKSAEIDLALAALLKDLKRKRLLDSTVVWMGGEFGRTPRIGWDAPWNGGRNHYATCFSALIAGGGFKGGVAVGESDETASRPVSRPVSPQDFIGSIYERCGIDPEGVLPNNVGKKLPILPPSSGEGRLKELYL
jgi:uncharacterized protein (DUF1501 family)